MTCLAPMTTPFWPAASSWHFLVCCCSLCPLENACCHYLPERRRSAIGLQKSERSWWRIRNARKILLKRRCELVTCQGVLPHTCEEISFLNFLTLLLNCKSCVLISIFGDCLSIYMCIIWWIHFGLAYIIIIIINFIFSFTFMAFFNLCLFKKKKMLFELEWVKLLMIVIFFFWLL